MGGEGNIILFFLYFKSNIKIFPTFTSKDIILFLITLLKKRGKHGEK
jgi:hypothetical protein